MSSATASSALRVSTKASAESSIAAARAALLACTAAKPSRPPSAYALFLKKKLSGERGVSMPKIFQVAAAEWKKMSDAQKAPFAQESQALKAQPNPQLVEPTGLGVLKLKNEKAASLAARTIAVEVLRGFVDDLQRCVQNKKKSLSVKGVGTFAVEPRKEGNGFTVTVKLPSAGKANSKDEVGDA